MSDVGYKHRVLYNFTMARSKLHRFAVVVASSVLVAGLIAHGMQTPAAASAATAHVASGESLPNTHDGCAKDQTGISAADCLAHCAIAYVMPALVSIPPALGREARQASVAKALDDREDPPDPPPPR